MPDHRFDQKSREDLVVVATLAGLLSPDDAQHRSKPELVALLASAEQATGSPAVSAAPPTSAATPKKRGRPRATAAADALSVTAGSAPAEAVPAPAPVEMLAPVETPMPIEAPSPVEAVPARRPLGPRVGRAHRPAAQASPSEAPAESPTAVASTPSESLPDVAPPVPAVVPEPIVAEASAVRTDAAPRPERGPRAAHVRPARPERTPGGVPDANRHPARPVEPNRRPGVADRRPAAPDRRPGRHEERGRNDRNRTPQRGDSRTQATRILPSTLPSSDYADEDYRELETTAYEGAEADARTAQEGEEAGRRPQLESGETVTGVLELMPDGYGFLRRENYLQGTKDIYVPPQYIRRFNLRNGDHISGPGKVQRESDRFQALLYIKEVNGQPPENMIKRPSFDKLTPIYPDQRFRLETNRTELSTRIIDLIAPIGKGQRGMIVSPPKAGKTILLQKVANAISKNNPEAKLIVLLIDERPEEVTDMQRSINGEVVYSTFDKLPENHVKVAELVLDRAMRLVELGQDVVILMDSMTRLARAYNLTINPTGRTLSGGLDPGALQGPKRFFGAARNIEFGGSLTIIATSLIETGSRMDEVIFEEFKGTGNMELVLDRKLSEKRIFPAIDINKSGTRREELLLSSRELDSVWTIRKAFSQLDTSAVTEMIINLLLKTTDNAHFVQSVNITLNDKAVFDAMRGNRPGSNGGPTNGGSFSPSGGYGRNGMDD